MASIRKHGTGWRSQVFCRGVRDSQVFRTKREAESWAAARETAIRALASNPGNHTMADALARYAAEVSPGKRGARWELVRLAYFPRQAEFPASLRLADIDARHLSAWRDARLREVSAGAVLREFALLSSVFEVARREWRWIDRNPLADVRRPRAPDHRSVLITWRQIRAMLRELDHCSGPCRSARQAVARAFLLALRSGMRAGELCGLTWDRVHADYVELPVTKTTPRDVPLSPAARRVIESMRGWDSVSVFGMAPQSLDMLFRRARLSAGMNGFTFHDSRHVAATMLSRRLDVLTLCKVFGWRNTSQALTYYNPSAADIAVRISARH
jgi:integrase